MGALSLLLVPAVALSLPPGNLLKNPGAEAGPGAASDTAAVAIPGWKTTARFTAVRYGTSFQGGAFPSAPSRGGRNFFAGGPENASSTARQSVDVSGSAAEIDGGGVTARLSALIGGFEDAADSGFVAATFRGGSGAVLAKLTIGPVTVGQRGGSTRLLPVSGTGKVPKGTRVIEVVMTARRARGFYNDAYFDNLRLTISTTSATSSQ